MGLSFSSTRKIPRGETVSWFNGEVLSVKSKKFNDRVKAGHNKYMLGLGDFFVLDCYPNLNICKASRCNSAIRAATFKDNKWIPAVQNCELSYDLGNKLMKIKSIANIDRFTELFVAYGKGYKFIAYL